MSNQLIQKIVNVSVSIRDCRCTEFNLTELAIENKHQIAFDKYKFEFNVNMRVDEKEKNVIIEIFSSLLANSDKLQGLLATIKSIHTFVVANFDEIAIKTDQGFGIPEQAFPPLLAVAFSNLRGMYAVKLENTIYANAVVPIVNVDQIIPKKASTLG